MYMFTFVLLVLEMLALALLLCEYAYS